jgi:hypothetical protein
VDEVFGTHRARDSVLGGVNGSWLLWVVGTQSLSLSASTLLPVWPSQSGLLAPAATGLWSVGLVLYLLLVSLILLCWLTVAMTPATLLDPDGRHRDDRPGRRPDPEPSGRTPPMPMVPTA